MGQDQKIEQNKATALQFMNALAGRRADELEQMMAPDFTWWTQGTLKSSGTYQRSEFVAANRARAALVSGTMTFTYGDVTAEQDRVAIEVRSHLELASGVPYSNTYHYLLKLRDGQVVSGKEYLDTLYVRETLGGKE